MLMLCGCDSRLPPAIQCPVPSQLPTSASGQTGCWNGSSMGTRPSIMSAWSMLMAPAAGTRAACPSGRSLLTSSSPSRGQWSSYSFKHPEAQASSPSLWSSGCHHLPHHCQPANGKYQVDGLASVRIGMGHVTACAQMPAQHLSRTRESNMTLLASLQPISPASQTLLV